MRLKKLREFRDEAFADGAAPTMSTLRRWPGVRKLGGAYYMDLDALAEETKRPQPCEPQPRAAPQSPRTEVQTLIDRVMGNV